MAVIQCFFSNIIELNFEGYIDDEIKLVNMSHIKCSLHMKLVFRQIKLRNFSQFQLSKFLVNNDTLIKKTIKIDLFTGLPHTQT